MVLKRKKKLNNMSNLTGQAIQDTYKGLLNLENSTSGITSTLQPIQDGLGNNTGARIGTNLFTMPNVPNINQGLIPDMMGTGVVTTGAGTAFGANSQNRLQYNIFYDTGVFSYSALTYNLSTLSSTSDVVEAFIYSLQLVPGVGIAPKDLIMSGITLESRAPSVTGVKTTTLPSTLSFSGTGGGYYVFAIYISNANVTPTVRYGAVTKASTHVAGLGIDTLGLYQNTAGTLISPFTRVGGYTQGVSLIINTLPVQTSYSVSDITTNQNTTAGTVIPGFGLRVIQ